jgi:hypothetical protein
LPQCEPDRSLFQGVAAAPTCREIRALRHSGVASRQLTARSRFQVGVSAPARWS